jgi:hypothetical protein
VTNPFRFKAAKMMKMIAASFHRSLITTASPLPANGGVVVRTDEKLTAFVELESAICAYGELG